MLSLSDITSNLCVAITDDGFVTHAGAVHILDNNEFWEIEVAKATLGLVDRFESLENVFKENNFQFQENEASGKFVFSLNYRFGYKIK